MPSMVAFSGGQWLVLGLVASVGLLAAANLLATLVRNMISMHDLQVRVAGLRLHMAAQVEAMSRDEDPNSLPEDPEFLRAYLRGEIDAKGRALTEDAASREAEARSAPAQSAPDEQALMMVGAPGDEPQDEAGEGRRAAA